MSTKQKTKAKPKASARKQKAKVTRKPSAQAKKPEKHVTEARPEKIEEIKETKTTKAVKEIAPKKTFLIAVRLQGPVAVPYDMDLTLGSLGLKGRFNARILEKNESTVGMLRNAKDYITWGEVKPQDIAALLEERAELAGGSSLTDSIVKEKFGHESIEALVTALVEGQIELRTLWQKGINPTFRLHPPSGAFHASIKRPFRSRGELGYRGSEISSLLTRMI